MSPAETPAGLLREARGAIRRMRETLLEPGPGFLEECSGPLAGAADCVRKLGQRGKSEGGDGADQGEANRQEVRALARELCRDLAELRSLMRQAEGFYLNRTRILLSAAGAYTAAGEADLAGACRSLSVDG